MGVSRTATRVAFGSGVLNLSIEIEIFHCDPAELLYLLHMRLANHVYQLFLDIVSTLSVLMALIYWVNCPIFGMEFRMFD